MSKNTSLVSRRAWNILRLALLWARKGGIFRKRLALSLTELTKGLKKLRHSNDQRGALAYGDHEFSFDATPIIHVKMHRPLSMRFKLPHIPCMTPQVDFEDFEFESGECKYGFEKDDDEEGYEVNNYYVEESSCEDEEIDLKAEEFIAKFYEQMKMQRQISYLQYDEKFNLHHN